MMVLLICSVFYLTACGSSSDSAETAVENIPSGIPIPIYIRNNTDGPIYELYISSAGSDEWGENRVKDTPLKVRDFYEGIIYYSDGNDKVWDIASVNESGKINYYYDVDFSDCHSNSVTVTLSDKSDGKTKAVAK